MVSERDRRHIDRAHDKFMDSAKGRRLFPGTTKHDRLVREVEDALAISKGTLEGRIDNLQAELDAQGAFVGVHSDMRQRNLRHELARTRAQYEVIRSGMSAAEKLFKRRAHQRGRRTGVL
jgi:uncharacterized small protein (DUF1192 family)